MAMGHRMRSSLSVHRDGIPNSLVAAGEDIAGIRDALRWKPPRMPLRYNCNPDAAGHLLSNRRQEWLRFACYDFSFAAS